MVTETVTVPAPCEWSSAARPPYRAARRPLRLDRPAPVPRRRLEPGGSHCPVLVTRSESVGSSPVTSPGAVSFETLPWHWSLVDRIASSRPGPNRLPGGEFEDLPTMLQAGWNHFRYASAELQTAAELVGGAARSGNSGLRLKVRAEDPKNPPAVVETPPLWITSPPLPVEAGQLVCIQGWVQMPEPITGSVDGLLILDSLAGETLARRIRRTSGWRQFTLWRAAPESGRMTVTFAMTGLGEVWIDDVTVRCFEPAGTGGLTRLPGGDFPPR